MDDQRFLRASQLREEGKFREAIDEFLRIAEDVVDPVDKAGVLLNIAATFQSLGEYDQARKELSSARGLIGSPDTSSVEFAKDSRLLQLEVSLDFEEADILSFEGRIQEALAKFDLMLKKYGPRLREAELRESYEMIQSRRGFILGDLGRCKEALPILEEAESFESRKAEIYFYLAHCYVSERQYENAQGKFTQALVLGLPHNLEYRAHCELGIVQYRLKNYTQAKEEFVRCGSTADSEYLKEAQIWKWLEITCRSLGLKDEADRYARLAT